MKKYILIAAILAATTVKAQSIDTVKSAILVKPIVYNSMKKDTIFQFKVSVFGVQLSDTTAGANSYIAFFDRKAKSIGDMNLALPSSIVNAWTTDDTSVINFILLSLGLTKK